MKTLYRKYWIWTLLVTVSYACEDFVEVDTPRDEIVRENVFSNNSTAVSAVSGIYSDMITINGFSWTNSGVERYTGLYADEFVTFSSSSEEQDVAENQLDPANGTLLVVFWSNAYNYLLNANSIIEGLSGENGVTDSLRNQLEGEAKFIRAFCHFYLTNLYGPIPLVTSTNFEVNNTLVRQPESEVYALIIDDLLEAEALMFDNFVFAGDERIRPNKDAASAFLARVYLFREDWQNAEQRATALINNSDMYALESDLNNVFLANSSEAIWQLQPVNGPFFLTPQAQNFIPFAPPSLINGIALSQGLFDAFESGDNRQTNWIASLAFGTDVFYYPFKYKNQDTPLAEYTMVFRLAEQYLIRAEARAQLGNLNGAIADLDMIRARAGLPLIADSNPTLTQAELLLAIEQERRVELFTEWGHRWLDLKRTTRADDVMSPLKTNWDPTDVLWPIPETEIIENPNLLPQNEGY
ncbi:MAG: RagB/SusD family nutrient uptake outer membrane protein [Cytophagales bacterium]|nr:RagB/SusD family nutrient uptake outer membrane protein [Cytophagales bacterium]